MPEAVAAGRFAPDLDADRAQRAADNSIDHETPLSEVFERPGVPAPTIVLLSKADLAGDGRIGRRSVDHLGGILNARGADAGDDRRPIIDPRVILGSTAPPKTISPPALHHDGETITSMTISTASRSACRRLWIRSTGRIHRRLAHSRIFCA